MNPKLAYQLVCLYPRLWREHYRAEFEAVLLIGASPWLRNSKAKRSIRRSNTCIEPLVRSNGGAGYTACH
jgi:hypothetical protein